MPGRQLLAKLAEHIESLGGDDVVLDRIANGDKVKDIAKSFRGFLPEHPEFPSRTQIYRWKDLSEERQQAWKEARRLSAHSHVEDAGELLEDGKPVTSAEASHLKARAGYKKWLAERLNREEYGDRGRRDEVVVSFGEQFLEMLREKGQMPRSTEPEMIPAEVIEE